MRHKLRPIAFFAVLGAASIANIAFMGASPEKLDQENRARKPWPAFDAASLAEGAYTRAIEEAFADRFLGRDAAIEAARWLSSLRGMDAGGIRLVAGSAAVDRFAGPEAPARPPPVPDPEASPDASLSPEAKPKDDSSHLAGSRLPEGASFQNSFLIVGNRGYETAGYKDEAADAYAAMITGLAALVPTARFYAMVVPSSVEYVEGERLKAINYDQTKGIAQIYAQLPPYVGRIDAAGARRRHAGEYIYHRTDHHWTALGAWYAYEELSAHMGFQPVPYERFEKEEIEGFLGTIYNGSGAPELKADPDRFVLVYPFAPYTMTVYSSNGVVWTGEAVSKAYISGFNKYLAYIDGDQAKIRIDTEAGNGRRVLVIKDSYANALVPYLIPHFEKIFVIDPRHWKGSLRDLIVDEGIGDVLFCNYYLVVSYYSGFASFVKSVY